MIISSFQETKEIEKAVGDFDVAGILNYLKSFALTYGPSVIAAILIFIIGKIVARFMSKTVRKLLEKRGVDKAVTGFVANMVYIVLLVVTVLAALGKFGVQTTSFVAILGAAGFAIGMAMQGSLGHFAAGVLILVLRPFDIGDVITGGDATGEIKDIRLFTTEIATIDNVKVLVPNGELFGKKIEVLTGYQKRRVVSKIGIGYGSDIGKARDIVIQTLSSLDKTLSDPGPDCVVTEWGDSSVNMAAVCWVNPADYWDVLFAANRQLKEAFDKAGIEIPFPQRVVHQAKNAA